ncbi:MAG: Do family serine endopeptidase [Candidatus Electryoneaceae bacterium]|nr:Do family serine endopeptidase [Candidatus Electryoneaceae bacterium]
MSKNQSTLKRIWATVAFAVVCFAIGYLMATDWGAPVRISVQHDPDHPVLDNSRMPTVGPLFDEEGNSPFVKVAEAVKPTVVNISAERRVEGQSILPFDLFNMRPFFGDPDNRSERRTPHITSGGSGIIVDTEGYILTNNHVIDGAESIKVKFADQSELIAEVVGTDPETDIALIKVNAELNDDMVAHFGNSDQIRIGEWAIAVGNPFGLNWTVTVGVISACGRSNLAIGGQGPSYQDFIQTDASINFGNSGGPLVNIRGEVIGVNTAINAQGQGIGFAIPVNLVNKVITQLRSSGEVQRGYLGIFPTELDEMRREALGFDLDVQGVFVNGVQTDTPADEGGMKSGDVIISINGESVENVTDFRFRIADFPPGTSIDMTVLRSGDRRKQLNFVLGDRSEYLQADEDTPNIQQESEQNWLGLEVAPTDGRQGRRLGVENIRGILVIGVELDSPSAEFIQPGDVITEIGNREVISVEDFYEVAEQLKDRRKAIAFWVIREGRETFIPIRPDQE